MPYVIYTAVYPSDKGKEVAERYIEILRKYPPDENLATTVVRSATKRTENGVKTLSIAEIKAGKLEETFIRAANAMAMFNDIQGYEYTMDVYLTAEEALATLGMSIPG